MKDLLKLYSFESVHGSEDEKAICDWICKWLDAHKITGYIRVGNNIYKKGKRIMEKSVFVSEHKVKRFMQIAQPQYPFKVEKHRQQCIFTFSNEKDLERAEIANGYIMLFDNK